MARTQKNKATNAHLGMLKARLAKLRQELITPKGGGGGGGEGFDVAKTGRCTRWFCRIRQSSEVSAQSVQM
ncbi:GTP-binding protein [Parelaphostrongylus tenuis]|uniref:GTP-binding protein n=1 Tax=Parelaphostrongylus tenuis TaxID=148309 RepID=A0AAD5WMU8_PARTN|nr:GTP-binding protein [Parelaphostrongylus tenuis]